MWVRIMWHTQVPEEASDSTGAAINAALHVFNQEGHSPWEDSHHLNKTEKQVLRM